MRVADDRSFGGILQDIVGSVREIIRLEIRLATAEVSTALTAMRRAAVLIAAGSVVLIFSLGFLLLALVHLLSTVMPTWAASLVVGGGTGILGATCTYVGLKRLGHVRSPKRTMTSLQEDLPWPTTQMR